MNNNSEKSFIPKDKPKSWVLFILGCLSGLLVAAPIAISGVTLKVQVIKTIGISLFIGFLVFGAIMYFVYIISLAKGRYKDIESRDWKEQIW